MKRLPMLFLLVGLAYQPAVAQFTTPTVDGSIGASEYGTHTDGQNQITNGGQIWFMTWDNSNLYVAVSGVNTGNDAITLYIDHDPITPVNGGANSDGSLAGPGFDNVTANLPIRADFFAFVKSGFDATRLDDGAGGWGSAGNVGSKSSAGSVTEFSIPWSSITGGSRPSSFNWLGYVSFDSGNNGTFAHAPTENATAAAASSRAVTIDQVRYFTVSATTDGSSTKPFNLNSYTFVGTSDASGFGSISVFDFTMNSNGRTITRGTGAWTIAGTMRVNDGTVSFGATTDNAAVTGDVIIGANGTLTLSSGVGGDLDVGGGFTQNGTFNPSQRDVEFNGTSAQTLTGSSTVTFDFMTVNNANGVTLTQSVIIDDLLTFTSGKITLGTNTLTVNQNDGGSAGISGESSSNYVVANSTGALRRANVSSSTGQDFPVGTATSYMPLTITSSDGATDFAVLIESTTAGLTNRLDRQWDITRPSGTGNADITFQWNQSDEGTGFDRASARLFRHNGSAWSQVDGPSASGGSNPHTVSFTGISTFSDFTLGSSALPIELADFTARLNAARAVLLWSTLSETNNAGFEIQHATEATDFATVGYIEGAGTTTDLRHYRFETEALDAGTHRFRLKQVDLDGQFAYSPVVEVAVGLPGRFVLEQAYPNPFNPRATVRFAVQKAEQVQVALYNVLGQQVQMLYAGTPPAGALQTLEIDGSGLPSGIYLIRLTGEGILATQSVTLLK